CRDLGGRRVGVLAEQVVGLDVRACAAAEAQEAEPLRVTVTQQGPADFVFRAVAPGGAPTGGYQWDFGDGASRVTAEPTASHVYGTRALGPEEVRDFTVRLSARDAAGGALSATAFVRVRGQPASEVASGVTLESELGREPAGGEGWRTRVVVQVPEDGEVSWERVERVTVRWDDSVDVRTQPWREVITVEEPLGRGGFRGHVTVRPSEVTPELKQVVDTLHGRDAAGRDVVLSWAAFKRAAGSRPPLP
ncbi:PKD domain-containing protein, partial [Pyxidicoccus sp. 3LFB2]